MGETTSRRRLFTDSPLRNEESFCACVFPPCARYYVTLLFKSAPDRSTMSNKMSVSTLLLLLLFLVEVHSQQTFPYVSFGLTGPAMADHSYVDLSTVGVLVTIVTVLFVTLTWAHVVVIVRVLIMETGVSLMELYCHSLLPLSLLVWVVQIR